MEEKFTERTFLEVTSGIRPEFAILDQESGEVKEKVNRHLTQYLDVNDNDDRNNYELIMECAIIYCSFETIKKVIDNYHNRVLLGGWSLIAVICHKQQDSNFCQIIDFLVPYIDFSDADDSTFGNLSGYCFEALKDNCQFKVTSILDKAYIDDNRKNKLIQWFFKDCLQYGQLDLYVELLDYGYPDNFHEIITARIDHKSFAADVFNKCFKHFLESLRQKQVNLSLVCQSKFILNLPVVVEQNIYSFI